MKGSDVFPGKYLRAADLDGREPIVTIAKVIMETLGDDTKPVVYFKDKDKGLVMNKTNWNAIGDITGSDDSDNWTGAKVKLITAKVEFQGKRVPAIRIESAGPASRQVAAQRMEQARTPKPEPFVDATPVDAPDDSDIPFSWLLPIIGALTIGGGLL